ncbi:isopenicillin N synthase family dioxygenase [Nocardioides bruguierae]|uniref:isopenicillin N synthase family dioxygenase n=1 Tax=Nocardioides bruguierae TaxID=2945102 RepID=UPI002021E6C2|nr:2-oxoglutarate and iron-dependent oxygenase domain-containing protein [Nocardioides bruguierae]MCL8024504.1 isopenicillin N synthase family oxygenase [Nocardioides bruguierae]
MRTPFTVPTVDVTPYVVGGTAAERAACAAAMDAACREVGFVQVVGHGVPTTTEEAFAAALDAFFGQDLEAKKAVVRPPHENRGYTPPRSESLALSAGVQSETRMKDFFEALNVGATAAEHAHADLAGLGVAGHYAENTWPDVPGFREAVDAWRAEAGRVARTLVDVFTDALDLAPEVLGGLLDHPIELLRMNNYALEAGTEVELDEDLVGMGEHTDFGIVTVLWADRVRGLQVLHEGSWHDVSPAPGALLVNLGDLTTRLTNEQWLSTLHRVKPPIVGGTIERRRSAAFFLDGDAEKRVGPLPAFVDAEHPPLYAPVTIDEHVAAKLSGSRAGVLNSAAEREAARLATSGLMER